MKILDIHFSILDQPIFKWKSQAYEFHYFLSSNGTLAIESVSFPIHRETLFFLAPQQEAQLSLTQPHKPLGFYSLAFETSEENPLGAAIADPSFQTLFPFPWENEGRLFFEQTKKKLSQVDNPYKMQSAEWGLVALVANLVGEFYGRETVGAQSEFNIHVEQALEFLQNNIYNSLSLKDICDKLKITEEHLIRLFKKTMNMTPMKYLNNLKIEAASSLLLTTDLSIKEIAWRLGFSSPFHFSRNFKLHSGCSPMEYRANYYLHNPQGLQRN